MIGVYMPAGCKGQDEIRTWGAGVAGQGVSGQPFWRDAPVHVTIDSY